MTHNCVGNLTIIASDNGLSPDRRQAIIWTNARVSVNGTLRNKLQWNLNWNSNIFIQENVFESVVCEMAAILSRPQCVNAVLLIAPASYRGRHLAYSVKWWLGMAVKHLLVLDWMFFCYFGFSITSIIYFFWVLTWIWFQHLSPILKPAEICKTRILQQVLI